MSNELIKVPPHPDLGCFCEEGRIIENGLTVRFLPGVHDCQYIRERNATLPVSHLPKTDRRPFGYKRPGKPGQITHVATGRKRVLH